MASKLDMKIFVIVIESENGTTKELETEEL